MGDLIELAKQQADEIARAGHNGWGNTMAALAAALEAAREDSARLDWFDANWFSAYRQCDPIDGLSKHCVLVDESQRSRRGLVADTMRAAIDQARGKESGND